MSKEPRIPVTVELNFDTHHIPKGKWINETRKTKNGTTTVKTWHRDLVWIVWTGRIERETRTVAMLTYWIPDEKRFCFLNPGQESGISAWAHGKELRKTEAAPRLPEKEKAT